MSDRNVPVLVNCRDRLAPLRLLVEWLERAGHERIVLVDNASTYPPLLEFYASTPHQVVRLDTNIGQRAVWESDVLERLGIDGHFVLTDPDVVPSEECPLDAVSHLLDVLGRHPEQLKVGLGLRIDDLPGCYRLRDVVVEWERAFWQREVEPGVFDAPVDTTFAVHAPGAPYRQDRGLRTGPPYVARHLPWYADSDAPTDEDRYYLERAREDVLTWGTDTLAWAVVEGLDLRRNAGSRRPVSESAFGVGEAPGVRLPVRVVSVLVEEGADAAAWERGDTVGVELVPVDPDARNRAHGLNLAAERATGDVLAVLRRGECLVPGALAEVVEGLGDAMWLRGPVEIVDGDGRATGVDGDGDWSFDGLLRQDPVERPWLCWRRDALGAAGGFDESVPLLCEYEFEIRLAERHHPAVLTAPVARRRVGAARHWPPRRVAEHEQVARVRARNRAADVAALEHELATARAEASAASARADDVERQLAGIRGSRSWRLTRPLRDLGETWRARRSSDR